MKKILILLLLCLFIGCSNSTASLPELSTLDRFKQDDSIAYKNSPYEGKKFPSYVYTRVSGTTGIVGVWERSTTSTTDSHYYKGGKGTTTSIHTLEFTADGIMKSTSKSVSIGPTDGNEIYVYKEHRYKLYEDPETGLFIIDYSSEDYVHNYYPYYVSDTQYYAMSN